MVESMDDGFPRRRVNEEMILPGLELDEAPAPERTLSWADRVQQSLLAQDPNVTGLAEKAVQASPLDGQVLVLAALAMLIAGNSARAFAFLRVLQQRFRPAPVVQLLLAIGYAQKGQAAKAGQVLDALGIRTTAQARYWFPPETGADDWLDGWLKAIRRQRKAAEVAKRAASPAPVRAAQAQPHPQTQPAPPLVPELPRLEASFTTSFAFTNLDALRMSGEAAETELFRLRGELSRLSLFQGFDELLCLPALHGVETHWYQVETVRKVLKQYRGRVLLADEVGLGKTIEAGMVVKEYMLRGMAERLLILVPAALVGQWREEMAEKFGIDCATTHDPLLRTDPQAFWRQPRVIASIAAARRKEHAELLTGLTYDVVVVDEAHHLRDQASASYRLVNSLQKRFLLLLSATPVQNNLIELYNLLTLLQPGIFKTQKEFRAAYMVPGKPREPVNREKLRDLMRGVMVRNTRALAALRLPRRHAATLRATPTPEEAECYRVLTELARGVGTTGQHRMAVQHLLAAAGSSPAAAAAAITRLTERKAANKEWKTLLRRYGALQSGAKEQELLELLARNPAEKKMVFVHHRESMAHLVLLLRTRGKRFATFDGSMSGPEKDAAVADFRDSGEILLCSESGGEGRNLQFCNTLINFDIPWNPMAIEQRTGRIDRIGQTREVFVFNLATTGTIEDRVLRILDDKINMFELVVGEVGAILGELDEQQEFSTMVLDAWLQETEDARAAAFTALEAQLTAAQQQYEGARQLDEALFGNDLDAA
jgi:superfamily II DNA or RNA helicase